MTGTLVDSNVILDVATEDPEWFPWSSRALADAGERGPLWINPIIYAEISVGFSRIEELEAVIPSEDFRRSPLPWPAVFLAGRAFASHRRRGGARTSPLPDFYIGAHAAVAGLRLLTRDARRYATYFPSVHLVHPGGGEH